MAQFETHVHNDVDVTSLLSQIRMLRFEVGLLRDLILMSEADRAKFDNAARALDHSTKELDATTKAVPPNQ